MPLPTSGEIKAVAEVGEAALREVAPSIAAKLTEELTSIYGKGKEVISDATKGHEKLAAAIENIIGKRFAQTAAQSENAGLRGVVKKVENPFAGAEPANEFEIAVLSREDAIKAFEGTDAARARFEQALTRIDEASVRKIEAVQRAESVNTDRTAITSDGGLKVRTVKPEDDHIQSIEEFSNGRKVIFEKTEYPVTLKKITEEPDGTRVTERSHWVSGDGSPSEVDAITFEHANGNLERRLTNDVDGEHETSSGTIQHNDGSLERWTDEDLVKVTHFEDKNGVVTSHRDSEEYDKMQAWLKARFD